MCVLSQGKFCGRAPSFVVDILWDHLVLLQQDVDRDAAALKIIPSNLCKTLTDPVSMPRLPPSPPGAQQPQYHQSPQKTYLTLSPQRHTPYSAPTSPLSYTSLDYRQATSPLLVKTEFKQEFKAEYRVPHLCGSEQPLPPVQLVPGLPEATLLALPVLCITRHCSPLSLCIISTQLTPHFRLARPRLSAHCGPRGSGLCRVFASSCPVQRPDLTR